MGNQMGQPGESVAARAQSSCSVAQLPSVPPPPSTGLPAVTAAPDWQQVTPTSSRLVPFAQSTPHSMEDFDVDALGHLLLNTPTGVTACMEQGSFLFNFDDMPSPRLDTTVTRPVHAHKYETGHKKEQPARKRRRRGGKGSNSRLQARVQSGDIHAPDGLDMSVVHGDDHAEISLPSPLTSASLVGGDLEFKSLHLRGLSSVGGSHDVQPESAHFARAHWPRQ